MRPFYRKCMNIYKHAVERRFLTFIYIDLLTVSHDTPMYNEISKTYFPRSSWRTI